MTAQELQDRALASLARWQSIRLGDAVASVATPIARRLKLDCIDPETQELKPDSKCAKRKARWNGEPKRDALNRIGKCCG